MEELLHESNSTANLVTEIRKPSKIRVVVCVLFVLLLALSITFIVLYVREINNNSRPTVKTTTETTTTGQKTCSSPGCVVSSSDILQNLDPSVEACDDFYQYSCGGFVKNRHISDEQMSLTSFTSTQDSVDHSLKDLLEDKESMLKLSKDPNSAVYKALIFYKSCMNESKIEMTGTKPMIEILKKYGLWNIANQIQTNYSWKLEKVLAHVFVDLGTSAFISLDVRPDIFDASRIVFWINAGKTALFDEKQHLKHLPAEEKEKFRTGYKKFISRVFQLLGTSLEKSNKKAEDILELEHTFVELKKYSSEQKPYRKFMTVYELNSLTSFKFDWNLYFQEILRGTGKSIESDQKVLVSLPHYIKDIIDLLHIKLKSSLVDAIMWNVVHTFINSLPKSFREAKHELLQGLTGVDNPKPRWRTCGSVTNTVFEYATAFLFANSYLSEDARQRAEDLFSEIKEQFVAGLEEQTWMDYQTREGAREKLHAMKESIGYPSFIKDPIKLNKVYKRFHVSPFDLFQNQLNIFNAQVLNKIDQFGKPPDSTRFAAPPLGVNAFYAPRLNKMNVLMGILQKPFYGNDRLKALNYGGIGAVIGHEITHGFDVTGSLFDYKGNLNSWWSTKSYYNFKKRSQCLAKQYGNTFVYGRKVNGIKTLSENIADNGGLKYAYRAYRKWRDVHGEEDRLPALGRFNNDQLFFIGYAQIWCSKYREESIDLLMLTAKHSLHPVRVRVPLLNFPAFHEAFGCKAPVKTCSVW